MAQPRGRQPAPANEFHNLSPDPFTSVPKGSHRESSPQWVHSFVALGLLTYLLSHRAGWKIPATEDLARIWREGKVAIRAGMAELITAGYVYQDRVQGDRGRWRTITYVSSDPRTLEPIRAAAEERKRLAAEAKQGDQQPVDNSDEGQPPIPGSDPPESDEGLSSQVGPKAGYRTSADRPPVDRRPAGRRSADRRSAKGPLKDQETRGGDQGEEQHSSSSVRHSPTAGAARPEDDEPTPDPSRDELVRDLRAIRPDWLPRDIRRVLDELLDVQGRELELVRATFLVAAGSPLQRTPQGLLSPACPHWQTGAAIINPATPIPPTALNPPAPEDREAADCRLCYGSGWTEDPEDEFGPVIRCDHGGRSYAAA